MTASDWLPKPKAELDPKRREKLFALCGGYLLLIGGLVLAVQLSSIDPRQFVGKPLSAVEARFGEPLERSVPGWDETFQVGSRDFDGRYLLVRVDGEGTVTEAEVIQPDS